MKKVKLNVGASPIWHKDGWFTLDHKAREESSTSITGDASSIPLPTNSCETVFCSHMFEHIPHVRLESILLEFNRILATRGVVRILVPDMERLARAYVEKDAVFFKKAKDEDESLRTDLGYGGMFVNFIVSPGQDTALLNRGLDQFIAGYAHVYGYDFEMLRILLERTGFGEVRKKEFCESIYPEYSEPLHILGMDPVWNNLNQAFYRNHGLVHNYDPIQGKYEINFKVTGFDRDPETSLIVEAIKLVDTDIEKYESLNNSDQNYNRYAWSLLKDEMFSKRLEDVLKSVKK